MDNCDRKKSVAEGNHAKKIYGAAGIQDPSKMNLALGAKILWRIVTRKGTWWKEIIQRKT